MQDELHRLICKAGGVLLRTGRRHRYYQLDGVTITVHHGKRMCRGLEKKIKSQCAAAMRRRKEDASC